jgi:hypothetical protein
MVLTALAEGLDPSAAERVFGYRQATITTWLTRAGGHAEIFHERCFRNLHLPHLQLDELRTRLRSSQQVLWLWLAIDPCTKLLPVLELGPRTQHMAHTFIHALRQSLAPGCLPLFTSDGPDLRPGEEKLPASQAGARHAGDAPGDTGRSHYRLAGTGFLWSVEHRFHRAGESDRPSRRGSARTPHLGDGSAVLMPARPAGMVASVLSLRASARSDSTLMQPRERGGKRLAQRYRQRTPAMAAGRTHRRWTAREVLTCPLPPACA